MPEPWPMEKRQRLSEKLRREANKVAGRIGAEHVVIIAFYKDGEYMRMQDGGNPPMQFAKLYTQLASVHGIQDESPSKDIGFLS